MTTVAMSQTAARATQPGAVVRLRVRVNVNGKTTGLSRKRFYLVRGTKEQNQEWIRTTEQQSVVSRDCYYRNAGASEQLIKWLKENDCETIYCREIRPEEVEGDTAIPEFRQAMLKGEPDLGSRETAREWLTVNIPESIRFGFYQLRRRQLDQLIHLAENFAKSKLTSVMTDRRGTAYFTDLAPGNYVISNLVSTEAGDKALLWHCDLEVKQGDLGAERAFLISNRTDRNVKCVSIEKPLPVCDVK